VATRAGQVAMGSASSTYTMAGINSSASRAAQQGALSLVTSDAAGNLATATIDLTELGTLGTRMTRVEGRLDAVSRQANGGIAAAMALAGTTIPGDMKVAVSFNLSTYRGEQGFSGAAVAKIDDHVWVSGGFAGSTVKGSTGGRVGMTFGW